MIKHFKLQPHFFIFAAMFTLTACTPTIQLDTPKEGITHQYECGGGPPILKWKWMKNLRKRWEKWNLRGDKEESSGKEPYQFLDGLLILIFHNFTVSVNTQLIPRYLTWLMDYQSLSFG